MRYLRGAPGVPLILSMEGAGTIHWYMDVAFAVHKNMRSHTGMTMTMGRRVVLSRFSKQKINTIEVQQRQKLWELTRSPA